MVRVDKARDAFRNKDLQATKKAHSHDAIVEDEVHSNSKHKYIGDIVLGALDGIITTFAVVSGVAGASLSAGVVLILGFANLIADGLSMGIGNYLGTKAESEFFANERKREEWEIENYPEGEIEEIREIFRIKGFKGKDLKRAVEIVTSDKKVWVDTMMKDELGISEEHKDAIGSGIATFLSFLVFGFIPLLSYVLSYYFEFLDAHKFPIAVALTGITLFFVGCAKVYVTGRNWFKSGIEMLLVGGVAALAAYFIGYLLRGFA